MDNPDADRQRLARVVELIRARTPLEGLRVLDLACRTGVFTAGLATEGAYVLGIEGRRENYDQRQRHERASYVIDDVRDLGREAVRYAVHDVTLCLGILYHLDAHDAFRLLDAIRSVTRQFAIIDTHMAWPEYTEVSIVESEEYRGRWFDEREPGLWSSIGNEASWWFTEASLTAAILRAGWTSVERIPGPGWDGEALDRRWLVIS